MSSRNLKAEAALANHLQGLYRSIVYGPSRSLTDLERTPRVDHVLRHQRRDLLSARVALTPEEGEGYWEITRVRHDFSIMLSYLTFQNSHLEFVPSDGLVQFDFKLSGNSSYRVSRHGPEHTNPTPLQVWRRSRRIDMRSRIAPSSQERRVMISVRPEFLLEDLLPSSGEMPSPLRALVSAPAGASNDCQLPLTEQMMAIMRELIDNPHQGTLYLMYVEARALELLCFAVANFWSFPHRASEEYSTRELSALSSVRRRLMEQHTTAPTLPEIARSVGLGEKALERGFTTVYGETPFDFCFRCRMQHALTLLRDRRWPVDRVSEASGYSHPTTFATAFRRHFGLRPTDLQRKGTAFNGSGETPSS
jgi:AraC-like DNA-binding protein